MSATRSTTCPGTVPGTVFGIGFAGPDQVVRAPVANSSRNPAPEPADQIPPSHSELLKLISFLAGPAGWVSPLLPVTVSSVYRTLFPLIMTVPCAPSVATRLRQSGTADRLAGEPEGDAQADRRGQDRSA